MTNAQEHIELIEDIAVKIASRYTRRVWWASRADLEQAARTSMVYAISKFDPSRGANGDIPLGSYLWMVARNEVAREVMKESSPVSAMHRRTNGIGLTRASLTVTVDGAEYERAELAVQNDLDDRYETLQRAEQIRRRLESLLGASGAAFALKVLTGDVKPAQVAEKSRIPVERVYAYNRDVREALREDPELMALWSNA